MAGDQQILNEFEIHSAEGIRQCFEQGVDPNSILEGKPLVFALINMYLRSPRFKDCMREFVNHGLEFPDQAFLAVLLDDASMLQICLKADKNILQKTYSLDGTFTPLYKVSLLHICAEYNHIACAGMLFQEGADINAKAGTDEYGFGGQTPIFHAVNQHANNSLDMLKFLLGLGADIEITIKGLIWGKGYDWETFIPAVNPTSYAMMGLLRQFQRTEKDIYTTVALLLKAKTGIDYFPVNIPNKYLNS